MNLELKRNKFCIIVGADRVKNYDIKIDKLTSLGINYATILHDKDVDINGVLKNKHWHLVVKLEKRVRGKTFLNQLCDILKTNVENIQIDECYNFVKSIQYLIHKNDETKYQYNKDYIITNIKSAIDIYMSQDVNDIELTTDMLIEIVENSQSLIDIMRAIGIGKYNAYRNTIKDIIDTIKDMKMLAEN